MSCIKEFIALLGTLFVCGNGGLQPLSYQSKGEISLHQCILNAIDRSNINHLTYLRYSRSIYKESGSTLSSFEQFESSVISHIHQSNRWSIKTDFVNHSDDIHWDKDPFSHQKGVIVLIESSKEIKVILKKLSTEHRTNKFFLILKFPLGNLLKVVSKMIKPFSHRSGLYFKIIAPDSVDNTTYILYSWRELCGKPIQRKISFCRAGIFYNRSSSIEKKALINQCSLTAAVSEAAPFVIVEKDNKKVKGIEVMMMDVIASELNINISYIQSKDAGVIHLNGTMPNVFVLLKNGSADIAFGGYVMSEVKEKYFRSSVNYIDTVISWCAPYKKSLNYDKAVNAIFSVLFIVSTCIVCICASFVTWFISNLDQRESPLYKSFLVSFLNTFSILFGISLHALPRTDKLRTFMGLFIIGALFLNILYSSHLTSQLVSATFGVKYDSVDEIYKDNLTTYAEVPIINFLHATKPNFASELSTEEILRNFVECDSETRCLEKVAESKSVVYLPTLERDYLFKEKQLPYRSLIHCSQKPLHRGHVAVYVRKEFPLMETINNIVGRIASSGLIIKWKNDVAYDLAPHTFPKQSIIQLKHLLPVIKIYFFANCLAILIFVAELIVGKLRKFYK